METRSVTVAGAQVRLTLWATGRDEYTDRTVSSWGGAGPHSPQPSGPENVAGTPNPTTNPYVALPIGLGCPIF